MKPLEVIATRLALGAYNPSMDSYDVLKTQLIRSFTNGFLGTGPQGVKTAFLSLRGHYYTSMNKQGMENLEKAYADAKKELDMEGPGMTVKPISMDFVKK